MSAVGLRTLCNPSTNREVLAPSSVLVPHLSILVLMLKQIFRESTQLNNHGFANLSQCFAHLRNRDIFGNILPMFPGRLQVYQELKKSASSPIPGEGSLMNFVRTQGNKGDNTFVGPPRNLSCCQEECFVGDPLGSCISCLMNSFLARAFSLFVEKSGPTARRPSCLISTFQSRSKLESLDF